MRHARASSRRSQPPAWAGDAPAPAPVPLYAPAEEGFAHPFKKIPLSLTLVGLCLYLFVIFSGRLGIGEIAISVALVGVFVAGKPLRLPAPLLWLGAFVLWSALALPSALYKDAVVDSVIAWGKIWLIFFAMVNAVHGWRQLRFLCAFVLLLHVLYPVRGTLMNFIFQIGTFGRYGWNGAWRNPNDLAAFMLLPLSLALGIGLVEEHKRTRFLALSAAATFAFIIVITQSRAGFIALAFLGLVTLVRQRGGQKVRVFATVAILAGIMAVAAPAELWQRLSGLKNVTNTEQLKAVDTDGSAEARFGIWRIAAHIINDNLVAGVGSGSYKLYNKEYALTIPDLPAASYGTKQTHSIYLNLLAETGVVGFALYMGLIVSVLMYSRQTVAKLRPRAPRAAVVLQSLETGFIAFFIAGIFGVFHYLPMVYLQLGLMYGFTEAVDKGSGTFGRRSLRTQAA